jgi:serine/threonine protein kinase
MEIAAAGHIIDIPKDFYRKIKTISRNSKAEVYLATNKDGKYVIVKQLFKKYHKNTSIEFLRDYQILKRLGCVDNIACIIDGYEDIANYYVVSEYFPDTATLEDLTLDLDDLSSLKIGVELALIISKALQTLHNAQIVHRDIKSANILYQTVMIDGTLRYVPIIIDFDLACVMHDPFFKCAHQRMGTPIYMAPEIFEYNFDHLYASDVYSLGMVFYEMFSPPVVKYEYNKETGETFRKVPANPYVVGDSLIAYQKQVIGAQPTPLKTSIPELNDLVGDMLIKDPTTRVTLPDVIKGLETILTGFVPVDAIRELDKRTDSPYEDDA